MTRQTRPVTDDMGTGSLPDLPARRASDDDRQQVITRLRDAAGNGVLDLDELEERIGAVYGAKTLPELAEVTADLPAPRAEPPAVAAPPPARKPVVPALGNAGFQHHLTVYVLTIGMLIGIWLLTGAGHFWPFYPAAGWGIGLGSHFMAVNRQPSDRDRRRDQELRRAERHADHERRRTERHRIAPPSPPEPPPTGPAAGADRSTRFVVAMFVDVVGSTSLNEALGDDGWHRTARTYESGTKTIRISTVQPGFGVKLIDVASAWIRFAGSQASRGIMPGFCLRIAA